MMETHATCFLVLLVSGLIGLIQCSRAAHIPEPDTGASSNIDDQGPGVLERLRSQLKEKNIFDPDAAHHSRAHKKQLDKLFDAVEIMLSSRVRQPASAQNAFVPLRTLQRALDKQLKDGLISRSLYNEFHWERLNSEETA